MPRSITRQREIMRRTHLGSRLRVIVNEKPLHLEKKTSIVLSLLLSNYGLPNLSLTIYIKQFVNFFFEMYPLNILP